MDASLSKVTDVAVSKKAISLKATMILVTAFNFMWAFSHTLLDVLNKHFQDVFHISHGQSAFVQAAYLGAYFLSAIPVGLLMKRFGYRNSIIVGLLLFAIGCMGFVPAAKVGTFSAFLTAIFILASGLACLEIVCNLYATKLGDPQNATRRLTLAQAFGGMGGMCGPLVGGAVFFIPSGTIAGFYVEPATLTYAVLSLLVLCVVGYIISVKLPEANHQDENSIEPRPEDTVYENIPLLKNKNVRKAMLSQFCYNGAHFGIGAFFINYVIEHWDGISPSKAAYFLSMAMFCYMSGRFLGIFVMKHIDPRKLQIFNSSVCVLACLFVSLGYQYISVIVLICMFLFKSTLYPTIFSMGVRGLGKKSQMAASLMVTMFVGGAIVPLVMGYLSDITSISMAFIVPAICYSLICWCAITQDLTGYKHAK
ncbi:MFS transporter [Acinetobacter sp. ANC 4635]|uniref:MFS transporter n=1 Tax=Acinetobacter sp. ANC 4635 TaxID=2529846 RepID=UPI001039C302|nr:MFS transporter [Acinetobacter sp. ANC 4635]TCB24240.1 MFS transporter [Acinetobacter sp. ANC 4635]